MSTNDRLPDSRQLPSSAAAATRQRRAIASQASQRKGFDNVDPDQDVRRTPEGFEIRDRVKRLAAARRLEGEVTLDELDPNRDLEETANGFRLSERGRRRAAAKRLESETVVSDLDPQQDLVQQEDGYQLAAQRRKEIAADRISDQSQLFDELSASEIALTEDGAEVKPDALKAAGAEELESQSEYLQNLSPDDVQVSEDGIAPTQDVVEQAEQRATTEREKQAAADILAQRIEGFGFAQPSDVTRQNGEYVLSQSARDDLQSAVESGVIDEGEISNIDESVDADNLTANSAAVAEQRQEFAESIESGEAFSDLPDGVDASSLIDNVDPQDDVVVDNGELALAAEAEADVITAQIQSQLGDRPGLNTDNVLRRAVSQDEIYRAVEEQIESQSGTDVRPGLIEDANLNVNADGTISANRVLLNSRRFDDFRDVSTIRANTDLLDGANLSVDATEEFQEQIEQSIAEQVSDRNVVDVSADDIDLSGGSVDVQAEESLTVDPEEITADGLQSDAQQDLARRQLQRVQTTEGISVDTPVNNQAFANVSATLAQAADGGGSLSSATRIVAASDTVDNVGDLDDLPDSRIIAGLDPEMAADRFGGIDAQQVRDAQQAIQQRRQQLDNDPQSVLEDIASNEDEFINDATRIGVAGERGQRIRQAARSRINELEADIAANDSDVSAGDVGVTLTDDLSGIRSINDAGRQAIAEQVDSQLANFDSSEIEVSVADGQIQTSIEDSVRARFVENAERVEEIQARNRIADADPSIDRREIAVDAESGSVALTQEGLNQARLDAVDAETGPGEIVPDLNTQTQGADLDVRDIRLQRGEDGELQVGLSEMGRTRLRTERPSLRELQRQSVSANTGVNSSTEEIRVADPNEQFGDFVPDSIEDETRRLQQRTGQVIAGASNFAEETAQLLVGGPLEDAALAAQSVTGGDVDEIRPNARAINTSVGNAASGITSGVLIPAQIAGSLPQLGVEATETAVFAVNNPGKAAERVPGRVASTIDTQVGQFQNSPVETSAQLLSSLATTSLLFKGAQGTRAGPVARGTLQPGEELAKALGRRGVTGTKRLSKAISNPNFDTESRGQLDLSFSGRTDTDAATGSQPEVDLDSLPDEIAGTDPDFGAASARLRRASQRRIDTDRGSSISRRARQQLEDDSGVPEVDSPETDLRQVSDAIEAKRVSLQPLAAGSTAELLTDGYEPQRLEEETKLSAPQVERTGTEIPLTAVESDSVAVQGTRTPLQETTVGARVTEQSGTAAYLNEYLGTGLGTETATDTIAATEPRSIEDTLLGLEPDSRTDTRSEISTSIESETAIETRVETATETETRTQTETEASTEIETLFEGFESGRESESDVDIEEKNEKKDQTNVDSLFSDEVFSSGIASADDVLDDIGL